MFCFVSEIAQFAFDVSACVYVCVLCVLEPTAREHFIYLLISTPN